MALGSRSRYAATLGHSPVETIRRIQIELAKFQLANGDAPMYQVANAAGFRSAKRFRESLARKVGELAISYRVRFRTATTHL